MLILFSTTPPQGDTLGAFAPLLGMMGLALLLALLLNIWHFYDFDRREQQRRQTPPKTAAPQPRQRRRRGAARAAAARSRTRLSSVSALVQEPAEADQELELGSPDRGRPQQARDLPRAAHDQPE